MTMKTPISPGLLVPKALRDEWLRDQILQHQSSGYPREVAEQKALQDWRENRQQNK